MNEIGEFLRSQSTLTLATVSPEGIPAAADLYYAADKALDLYFISDPATNHARYLAANPRVAGSIHAPSWHWREIRGVQFEGVCSAVRRPAERAAALAVFGQKFTFLTAFAAAVTWHTVYRITPHWLRWLDNSVAFAHKVEWVMQDRKWVKGDGR